MATRATPAQGDVAGGFDLGPNWSETLRPLLRRDGSAR